MNQKEILDEVKRRRGEAEKRLANYAKCRSAYYPWAGDTEGYATKGMDAQGRPLLRPEQLREGLSSRKGAPNYCVPIVKDFTALRSVIPAQTVPQRDASPQSEEEALLITRIIREQWEHSDMDLKQPEAAWYLSCEGETLYLLEPVFPDEAEEEGVSAGVYINVHPPEECFPRRRTGIHRHDLEDVAVVSEMRVEQARAQWGQSIARGKDRGQRVLVVHWYDRFEKVVLVGEDEVFRVRHDLRFCPAEWVGNGANPNMTNQSDIIDILDLHKEMATQYLVAGDAAIEGTYSPIVVVDVEKFPDQIPTGPGAVISVGTGGNAFRLQPGAGGSTALELVQQGLQHIQAVSGSAKVRTEMAMEGSNISGRAIRSVQGPMETRLAMSQSILGKYYERLNSKILRMLERLFADTEMSLWGEDDKGHYSQTFTGADIRGWTRTSIQWDPGIGSTRHERIVQAIQMHAAGAAPRVYINQQAGEPEPELLVKQADAEKQVQMQQAQQMQGGQNGHDPGAAQQQIMQPAHQAQALEGGGMPPGAGGGPTQPPPPGAPPPGGGPPQGGMPGFDTLAAPPGQANVGSPSPVPDFDSEVEQLIKPVAHTLRGHIVSIVPMQGGVRVTVTDFRDKGVLAKALAPMGKVRVVVDKGNK